MARLAFVRCLLGTLALAACREGSSGVDGAAPGTRIVGNCVMDPSLCRGGFCLTQRDGTFRCACAEVPAGQECAPCPAGYRYHGKYFSCEPTCAVVAPTCPAGQSCQEEFGVAMCLPAGDGGAGSAAGDAGGGDGRPPPGAACSCMSGCGPDEKCLENKLGHYKPEGLQCLSPVGLAQCRTLCGNGKTCPAVRPHCIQISIAVGCCADYTPPASVCCANADATSVENCF